MSTSKRPEQRAGSDKPIVLATNIDIFKLHEHCRGVLITEQTEAAAELYNRSITLQRSTLSQPADRIVIADIAVVGPLSALYRHTPLWQSAWSQL